MTVPTRLEVGKQYKLSWSSNPNWLYTLISWDHGGNCIVRSFKGKEFQTKTQDLRL